MKALVDGDLVVYRCGWASEKDDEKIALYRANDMLEIMLEDVKATEYEVWLSDNFTNNYRYQIDKTYKANRTAPRPIHYAAIKDFLIDHWNANLALGMEADDALGIGQTADTIICSIDKDLKQIPGQHYNFVKKEFHTVEYIDGVRQLYLQMLIGDTSDNIKGIDKIGPVKAGRLLDHITDEIEMFDIVRRFYHDDSRLLKNGKLLYIRRKDDEVWKFPEPVTILPGRAHLPVSMPQMPGVKDLYTERITRDKSGSYVRGGTMGLSMKVKLET